MNTSNENSRGVRQHILCFGGGFNPPHLAHSWAMTAALAQKNFSHAIVLPCATPPHKKNLQAFHHRLEMARIHFRHFQNVIVSELESKLAPPSYTYNTMIALHEKYQGAKFSWLVGSDQAGNLDSWHRIDALQQLVDFIVIGRQGENTGNAEIVLPNISSTKIRDTLRAAEASAPTFYLDSKVRAYIQEHGLYT